MTTLDVEQRIRDLCLILHQSNFKYYCGNPEIDDEAYEALKKELAELEGRHPSLRQQDSPLIRISGDSQSGFFERKHPGTVS